MKKIHASDEPQLSKWWKTPSAQAAFERAKTQRLARIEKMKTALRSKREATQRAVDQWEIVQ